MKIKKIIIITRLKKIKSENPNIIDSYNESNISSMVKKNSNIKLTTKMNTLD